VQAVQLDQQVLVSSSTALKQYPTIGWPDIAQDDSAVALRRDRVLLVNSSATTQGWDDQLNNAVTDMNDGYQVFDISGRDAMALLQRGTEISLQLPSRSAVRFLFGYEVVLYRIQECVFRIHIERSYADALWAHFIATRDALDDLNRND